MCPLRPGSAISSTAKPHRYASTTPCMEVSRRVPSTIARAGGRMLTAGLDGPFSPRIYSLLYVNRFGNGRAEGQRWTV